MEKMRNKDGKIISYREKVYIEGRAIAKTFKRKSDATAWKKSQTIEIQQKNALGIGHIRSIKFEDFCELWMEIKRNQGLAKTTTVDHQRIINKYLLPVAKGMKLERITQTHAHRVIQSVPNPIGPERKNKIITVFSQILNEAVKLDYLARNPLAKMSKIKNPPRSLKYWLPKEITQFLNANRSNPYYPVFLIALNTGMRRGELLGLCWDRVNLEKRRLEIARILTLSDGLKDTTKTGTIRYIPLNDVVFNVLKKMKEKKSHPRFVFPGEDGSMPRIMTLHRYFKKAMDRAGVPKIRFHDLRATYASNFVMAGGDIFALSKLLGHSKVEMTARRYAALHPEFLKNIANTIQFTSESERA